MIIFLYRIKIYIVNNYLVRVIIYILVEAPQGQWSVCRIDTSTGKEFLRVNFSRVGRIHNILPIYASNVSEVVSDTSGSQIVKIGASGYYLQDHEEWDETLVSLMNPTTGNPTTLILEGLLSLLPLDLDESLEIIKPLKFKSYMTDAYWTDISLPTGQYVLEGIRQDSGYYCFFGNNSYDTYKFER